MRELRTYIGQIVHGWFGLIGGAAGVVLTLIHYLIGRLPEEPIFWGAAIVCVIVAGYRAWLHEHRERVDLVNNVATSRDVPELIGKALQFLTFSMRTFDSGQDTLAVLIQLEVRNIGADSIVDTWAVSVMLSNGPAIGRLHIIPERQELPGIAPGAPTVVIYGKDAIYENTATSPIRRGAKAVGWIWATFDEPIDRQAFQTADFVVSFADVNGRLYSTPVARTSKVSQGAFQHFPGTTLPWTSHSVPLGGGPCPCRSGRLFIDCHGAKALS